MMSNDVEREPGPEKVKSNLLVILILITAAISLIKAIENIPGIKQSKIAEEDTKNEE